ncbi:hypothetical protein RMSM_01007 [Rhodopirellula maiorica SM1]|uniref:Uncharacterized protein n=1 Tax=Rhodopirellula maiorica SM1 TaxID=1265738 RepID=M5S7A3_9BACT|nr:hypothetical protein RMSM_01007 [Rhodopirellula maiorica SM1]
MSVLSACATHDNADTTDCEQWERYDSKVSHRISIHLNPPRLMIPTQHPRFLALDKLVHRARCFFWRRHQECFV